MRYLITLLLLGAGQGLYAQIITYDWHSRSYQSADSTCVKAGRTVTYQLTNVNTFAQKVRVDGHTVMITTDMPAELATLFRINNEAEKKLDNTQDQVDKMVDVQKDAAAPVSGAAKKLVDSCTVYYQEAAKIRDALDSLKQLISIMADRRFYNATLMRTELDRIGISDKSINAMRLNFMAFQNAYNRVYAQYGKAALVASKEKDKENEAKIDNAQEQVEKDYLTLEALYKETLTKIDNIYHNAVDPANYTVASTPIKVGSNVDALAFTMQVGDVSFTDTLRVTRSWKIDYSVGLIAKFISDEKYFFDANQTLQQRDKVGIFNTITPGIAPMLHVHRRRSDDITWGGMFGINADFKELTDINLGFLAGGFVMLGQAQKAIISGGLSYSNVNRLKAGEYSVGTVYKDVKIEDVTERVLRPSFFLSLSIAIPKREVKKVE